MYFAHQSPLVIPVKHPSIDSSLHGGHSTWVCVGLTSLYPVGVDPGERLIAAFSIYCLSVCVLNVLEVIRSVA